MLFVDELDDKIKNKLFYYVYFNGVKQLFPDNRKQYEIYQNLLQNNTYYEGLFDDRYWKRIHHFLSEREIPIHYLEEKDTKIK